MMVPITPANKKVSIHDFPRPYAPNLVAYQTRVEV